MGVYAFPKSLFDQREQQDALNECAHMVATAIFDRTEWGADDPVTRFLMTQLAAERQALIDDEDSEPTEEGKEPMAQ